MPRFVGPKEASSRERHRPTAGRERLMDATFPTPGDSPAFPARSGPFGSRRRTARDVRGATVME
jgi:hypothetical protein